MRGAPAPVHTTKQSQGLAHKFVMRGHNYRMSTQQFMRDKDE
jgi:hypothetical protein